MKKLALLFSVVLLLSLSSCGESKTETDELSKEDLSIISQKIDTIIDIVEKGGSTGSVPVQNITDDSVISVDDSADTSAEDTSSSADETTKNSSSASTTKKANTIPTTVEEIVNYYNKSANQVKTDKPGLTCKETPSVGTIECDSAGALVNGIKKAAMALVKPSSYTINKGEDHNKRFVVENQSWTSKLQPSSVKTATCKKVGDFYNIHILLKDEQLGNLPDNIENTRHGTAINIMSRPEIDKILSGVPFLEMSKFAPLYTGCYIDCKINIKTGKMHSATYNMNNIVDIEANDIIKAKVPYAIKKEFTINY